MKAYIDSSVLIRVVFRSPDPLSVWDTIEYHISSALLRVECARAIERLRLNKALPAGEIANRRAAIQSITDDMELVDIHADILARASGVFSAPLKALDAIHLATAIVWRDQNLTDIAFATHDDQLARAARAAGFEVLSA